jgi:serine/threonine protein phosphatase PrpC
MNPPRPLRVQAGHASLQGRRAENQDFVSICTEPSTAASGFVAAVADGVSHGKGGGVAAQLAVRQFLDAHYAMNPTLGVQRNAARSVAAINTWIHSLGKTDPAMQSAATTLTAAVLIGRTVHIVHVGDTRAYLLSDDRLVQLTQDHTLQRPESQHVLLRAIGMEAEVRAEFLAQTMHSHDRLMLCSDGVHGVLNDTQLRALLRRRRSPQEDADQLVEAALNAGSQDNVSCIVLDILEVPERSTPELHSQLAALPIAPPPTVGTVIDDFEITATLSDGRYSRLFKARDRCSGDTVVMKFPQQAVTTDATWHLAFVREAWVGARIHSPYVAATIEVPADRQTQLYSVMPFYEGDTLETRLARAPQVSFDEGINITQKLIKAVTVLHRAGIIHRDIKPDNVLLESNGGLRLIDLGVVRLPLVEDFPVGDIPGTPSYMAPELFKGNAGSEASDQFALAATLYRMWSGKYPYGEIEPFSRPRFQAPTALTKHRADLPAWLSHILDRALAVDPGDRFGDLLELSMEIDSGLTRAEPHVTRRLSLYERDPLRFWKIVSALLLIALVTSLATP